MSVVSDAARLEAGKPGSMLWRRMDHSGHDWARISGTPAAPKLLGTSIFLEEGISGRLDFRIDCDARWVTRRADVLGWVGDRKVAFAFERSPAGAWTLDGREVPAVAGCDDFDLSFTPATNLLAIRRLNLEVGQGGEARAAWLVFPDMVLRPLIQEFRRLGPHRYAYQSDNGFSTELEVDGSGLVVEYPPLWTRAMGTG